MARYEALLPREHGAYAELAFPLITGVALGAPSVATLLFAVAALAFFFVHEPLAVLLGVRGQRLRDEFGAMARRRAAWLSVLGIGCGLAAMLTTTTQARLATMVPIAFGVALVPALSAGRLKTLGSELLVIAALSSTVIPLAVSGGETWQVAAAAAGVWFVTFALGTIAVHAIKSRHKETFGSKWTIPATPIFGVVTIALASWAAATGSTPVAVALALLPAGISTLAVGLTRVHPKRLKRVGWSLVGANTVALLLLISL